MKHCKRLLSLLMALVMLVSMLPTTALAAMTAEPAPEGPVTAYLSLAHDDKFMEDANHEAVALRKLTVPYFNLANYGLENFYFQSEQYQPGSLKPENADPAVYEGKVTVLHLIIYATEVLKFGVAPADAGQGYLKNKNLMTGNFEPQGNPGSLWINVLWGFNGNMNYYVNHAFPMAATGFGSTLDQRLLREGDVVTFGHFTDQMFFTDARAPFNHLEVNGQSDRLTVDSTDAVSLQVIHDGGGVSGDPTTYNKIDYPVDVYVADAKAAPNGDVTAWVKAGTTDAAGALTGKTAGDLAKLADGNEVLVGVAGQSGQDNPAICVSPAAFRLTVNPVAAGVKNITAELSNQYSPDMVTPVAPEWSQPFTPDVHDYTLSIWTNDDSGYGYDQLVLTVEGTGATLQSAKVDSMADTVSGNTFTLTDIYLQAPEKVVVLTMSDGSEYTFHVKNLYDGIACLHEFAVTETATYAPENCKELYPAFTPDAADFDVLFPVLTLGMSSAKDAAYYIWSSLTDTDEHPASFKLMAMENVADSATDGIDPDYEYPLIPSETVDGRTRNKVVPADPTKPVQVMMVITSDDESSMTSRLFTLSQEDPATVKYACDIQLPDPGVTLADGKPVQLTPEVVWAGNGTAETLQWTSDNTAAATVDDKGLVTWVASGSANISYEGKYASGFVSLYGDPRETTNPDLQAADAVSTQIAGIGGIGAAQLYNEENIKAARAAYEQLTPAQQKLVTNEAVLTAMEERLAEIKANSVTITVRTNTQSVADDLSMLDLTPLPEEIQVVMQKGVNVVDVLYEASMVNYDFYPEFTSGFLTQIGDIGGYGTQAFTDMMAAAGIDPVPEIFQYAGWTYFVDGQKPNIGMAEYVIDKSCTVDLRYGVYMAGGTWEQVDFTFLDAYNGLKARIAEANALTEASASVLEAKASAQKVIDAIDAEACGMWLNYFAAKQTALTGPGSPVDQMQKADKALSDAIAGKVTPKTITIDANKPELAIGTDYKIPYTIGPEGASQEAIFDVLVGGDCFTVSPDGIITPTKASTLCMVQVKSKEAPNVSANLMFTIADPDQKAAAVVIDLIAQLPEAKDITAENMQPTAAAVKAARDAYSQLTPAQQKLVTNEAKLTAAENKLAELNRPTITVTVGVYDYTAVKAGYPGASENGVVFEETVKAPTDPRYDDPMASAKNILIQAAQQAGVELEFDSYTQVTRVGNLSSRIGDRQAGDYEYSTWYFNRNNDDFNPGLINTMMYDGGRIELHYNVNPDGQTDQVGTGYNGNPVFTKLTLAGRTLEMKRTYELDKQWNEIIHYLIKNGEEWVDMSGKGTAKEPFQLSLTVPFNTDLSQLEMAYDTSLDEHYRIVKGLDGVQDYTQPHAFSLSTMGGTHVSHYLLTVEKEEDPNKVAADAVIALIDELPTADKITVDDFDAVKAAQMAYDQLTAEGKAMVTNLEKLDAATARLAELIQPVPVESYWPNFRGAENNMAIVDVATPKYPEFTSLKWNKKLGSGWAAAPSPMIIVNDAIVVMVGSNIYRLDKDTGEVLASGQMVSSIGFGIVIPTYGNGMIFCPLSNGRVQAFDATTLESLWVYQDKLKGQPNCPISYDDGMIYTGFWNGETNDANYVGINVRDDNPAKTNEAKEAVWTKTAKGGYYWAGSVVVGDAVIFGTDDGTGGSEGNGGHLYALNKKTGEVISDITGLTGDQRSSIAYSAEKGRVYFTTKGGYLYSADVDAVTGALSNLKSSKLNSNQSTSTPVVYGDKVYLCCGAGVGGGDVANNFTVADADTLLELYAVPMKAYPQCSPLLSTAYMETEGKLYFYLTYNGQPGGITLIKIDPTKSTADAAESVELYDAKGFEQYCICSVICDRDGTLYYKNDSCNILAVAADKDATAAKDVANKIDAIGEVTLESKNSIQAARKAYDALTEPQKKLVTNLTTLTDAEAKLSALEKAEADKVAAAEVEAMIDAIGEVTYTPECKAKIDAAQKAYLALTKDQQKLVSNIHVWEEAKAKYHELDLQYHEDLSKASPVIEQIIAIGEVTLEKENQIIEARKAYDALPSVAKDRVQNYENHNYLADLEKAEAKLAQLKKEAADQAAAAEVEALIDAIGEVTYTPECKAKIDAAQKAYLALTKDQQKLVSNIHVWEEAKAKYHELDLRYHEDLSKAVPVIEQIIAIGEVTLEKENQIIEARKAYDALPSVAKDRVQNYENHNYLADLEKAEAKLAQLKKEAADQAAAAEVEALIDAIGEVTYTPECKAKIDAAQKAYLALTKDQQKLVSNIHVWEEAEAKYHEMDLQYHEDLSKAGPVIEQIIAIGEVTLEKENQIIEARKAYDALPSVAKDRVQNYENHNYLADLEKAEAKLAQLKKEAADQAAAAEVEAMIDAIGEVTADSKKTIEEARAAYDALTADQKALVTNLKTLTAAEKQMARIEADKLVAGAVDAQIANIGTVTLRSEEDIEEARAAYDALTEDEKAYVTKLDVLIAAEEEFRALITPSAQVKIRVSDGKPVVTWTKIDGTDRYEVWYKTGDGEFERLYATTTGTLVNHVSAKVGVTYAYQVRTIRDGKTSVSETVTATAAQRTLEAPVTKLVNKSSNGKPYLTWTRVDGATKYEVYRKAGKNGTYELLFTTRGDHMTNTSAEPGVTYYYKVRAVAYDGGKSLFSAVKYRTCDCARPALTVTFRADGKPVLHWNKVDGAVKYQVYRSVDGGKFQKFYVASGMKLTNGSAKSGHTYAYKVQAICSNSYGNGALSASVTAKVK